MTVTNLSVHFDGEDIEKFKAEFHSLSIGDEGSDIGSTNWVEMGTQRNTVTFFIEDRRDMIQFAIALREAIERGVLEDERELVSGEVGPTEG